MTECNNTRMYFLREYPEVTYAFGTIFVIIALTASSSNLLVLAIIRLPGNLTKSNKILASLALSDFLVGILLSAVTAVQLLNSAFLSHCVIDKIRVFMSLGISGSSTMTVATIALDRYFLLNKMHKYKKYLRQRNLIILLSTVWLLPIIGACIRFVGRLPYLSMVIVCRIGPLIILIITYVMITKAVKKRERKLLTYKRDFTTENTTEKGVVSITKTHSKKQNVKKLRKSRTEIKLAKAVIILVACYLICIIPLSCWAVFGIINLFHNFMSARTWQFLYLCAIVLAYGNSSLNPVIYFIKTPKFRKSLKKIFKRGTCIYPKTEP